MWCCASKLQGSVRLLWGVGWRNYRTSVLFAISRNDFGALSVPVVSSCPRALRIRIKGAGATSPLPFRERVRIVARDEQKSIFRSAK